MTAKAENIVRTGIIAVIGGLLSGGATIAVHDSKISEIQSQFTSHATQAAVRHDVMDVRVRTLEVETAADIREIKAILQRLERDRRTQ